jgi:hypothetical protein
LRGGASVIALCMGELSSEQVLDFQQGRLAVLLSGVFIPLCLKSNSE